MAFQQFPHAREIMLFGGNILLLRLEKALLWGTFQELARFVITESPRPISVDCPSHHIKGFWKYR
jgi:hypothetical protein